MFESWETKYMSILYSSFDVLYLHFQKNGEFGINWMTSEWEYKLKQHNNHIQKEFTIVVFEWYETKYPLNDILG